MSNSLFLKFLHRIDPRLVWQIYAKKCKRLGLNKSLFIFSFDCDTEEDIEVVLEVHTKLQSMGITPVYAVPGTLLKKGENVYKKIYQTGAEFINHGGREHTYFDLTHNRHASCFFYDQQSFDDLRDDMVQGHQILQDVLGVIPKGWRTPHFGTFQKPKDLNFLSLTLRELGYKFSTSTSPSMGYKYAPIYKNEEIIEIPVTGIFSEPFNIMDTWAYFGAPDRIKTPVDYVKTSRDLVCFSERNPMLINIYGDPSHIYNRPEFFQAMEIFSRSAQNVNYAKLLEIVHENIRYI